MNDISCELEKQMIAHMSHLGLGSLAFFFPLSFLLNIADLFLFLWHIKVKINKDDIQTHFSSSWYPSEKNLAPDLHI